ncbi:Arc family DNA-binding protein [Paraburkholderia dipogonis]|uniref:Arc family DNA-binding protein n=1 Tax=Paraburkholderia dipogonis TaxID=1211383 RepID=UPI0038B6D693
MATSLNQDDYLKTALRLPRDLHAKIQEAGLANGRSMNAEIVARLEAGFDEPPKKFLEALDFAKAINEYGDAIRQLMNQDRERKSMLLAIGNDLRRVGNEMRKLHEKGRVEIYVAIAQLGSALESGDLDAAQAQSVAMRETFASVSEEWVKMQTPEEPGYLPPVPIESRNMRKTPIHAIEGTPPPPGKPKK